MVDQVGGQHYKSPYQHWDWVLGIMSLNSSYLAGNATKYIARWRKKNGLEDLDKAASYLRKLGNDAPHMRGKVPEVIAKTRAFVEANELDVNEYAALLAIAFGHYELALHIVEEVLKGDSNGRV